MISCHGFFSNPTLKSISISPSSSIIGEGTTIQLTATGVNDDGSTSKLSGVTWSTSSSSSSAASVDLNSGLVTAGNTTGQAIITAKSGSIQGTATVNVLTGNLNSITVTPATATLSSTLGQTTQQFKATGNLSDNSNPTADITNMVTWSSSNKNLVQITSSGLATVQTVTSSQSATVTAAANQLTGSATITVGP